MFLLLAGCALALAEDTAESPFAAFLQDPAAATRLQPTLDRLESEQFAEREAASRELAALPALPAFVRRLAVTETRAESGFRLRKLAAGFPIDQENARLNRVLDRLAKDGTKGQLGPLCQVAAAGIWTPAESALYEAARATATPADLPLIDQLLRDPSPTRRQLAAAALDPLPAADSTDRFARLLDDPDATTAMMAAAALATRQDRRSLPALARLLAAPEFQIRHESHAILCGISGRDFGFDPGAAEAARAVPAAAWRRWAESRDAAITGKPPKDTGIVLFNGRDLSGWEARVGNEPLDRTDAWEVVAGELRCKGKRLVSTGDLWTKARYEDFILRLEYLAEAPDCDSGIGLLLTEAAEQGPQAPAYLEVQLLPDNGGDIYQVGGAAIEAKGRPVQFQSPRLAEVKDQSGVWHRLKLTVRGGTVAVDLDGVTVNRTSKGPRGPGRIVLRNEGYPLAFRNLLLVPLPPAPAADTPP